MVLTHGALLVQNGELRDLINSKDKTISALKMKLKKEFEIKKEKENCYEKQVNLQNKINLQIIQLSTSLKKLPQREKAVVPPAFWGHKTRKKCNISHQTKPAFLPYKQLITATQPSPVTCDKMSDEAFIKKTARLLSRLQSKYGGAPPPSTRPARCVVPPYFCDMWVNLLSLNIGSPCTTVLGPPCRFRVGDKVTNRKDTGEGNTISKQVCPSVLKKEVLGTAKQRAEVDRFEVKSKVIECKTVAKPTHQLPTLPTHQLPTLPEYQGGEATSYKAAKECDTKQECKDIPDGVQEVAPVQSCNEKPVNVCDNATHQDPWLHSNKNQDPWPPCNCGEVIQTVMSAMSWPPATSSPPWLRPRTTSTPTRGRGPGGGPRRGSTCTSVQSGAASVSCFSFGFDSG